MRRSEGPFLPVYDYDEVAGWRYLSIPSPPNQFTISCGQTGQMTGPDFDHDYENKNRVADKSCKIQTRV